MTNQKYASPKKTVSICLFTRVLLNAHAHSCLLHRFICSQHNTWRFWFVCCRVYTKWQKTKKKKNSNGPTQNNKRTLFINLSVVNDWRWCLNKKVVDGILKSLQKWSFQNGHDTKDRKSCRFFYAVADEPKRTRTFHTWTNPFMLIISNEAISA